MPKPVGEPDKPKPEPKQERPKPSPDTPSKTDWRSSRR